MTILEIFMRTLERGDLAIVAATSAVVLWLGPNPVTIGGVGALL